MIKKQINKWKEIYLQHISLTGVKCTTTPNTLFDIFGAWCCLQRLITPQIKGSKLLGPVRTCQHQDLGALIGPADCN